MSVIIILVSVFAVIKSIEHTENLSKEYDKYYIQNNYNYTNLNFRVHSKDNNILVCDDSEDHDYIYRVNLAYGMYKEQDRVNFTIIDEQLPNGLYSTYEKYKLSSTELRFKESFFDKFAIVNFTDFVSTYVSYNLYDAYEKNGHIFFLFETTYDNIADQKESKYDYSIVIEKKYVENKTYSVEYIDPFYVKNLENNSGGDEGDVKKFSCLVTSNYANSLSGDFRYLFKSKDGELLEVFFNPNDYHISLVLGMEIDVYFKGAMIFFESYPYLVSQASIDIVNVEYSYPGVYGYVMSENPGGGKDLRPISPLYQFVGQYCTRMVINEDTSITYLEDVEVGNEIYLVTSFVDQTELHVGFYSYNPLDKYIKFTKENYVSTTIFQDGSLNYVPYDFDVKIINNSLYINETCQGEMKIEYNSIKTLESNRYIYMSGYTSDSLSLLTSPNVVKVEVESTSNNFGADTFYLVRHNRELYFVMSYNDVALRICKLK